MTESAALDLIETVRRARALLTPGRLDLLRLLREPMSAAALARQLAAPRQKINYHLRELEKEGLVVCIEMRRKGNCQERILQAAAQAYLISPGLLGSMAPPAAEVADRFASSSLIAACARAATDVAALGRRASDNQQQPATLTLSSELSFANSAELDRFGVELTEAIATLIAKYQAGAAASARRYKLLVACHPVLLPAEPEQR